MDLFSESEQRRSLIGKTAILYKKSSTILTPASGFMNLYDYTLNPYSGCSFGCTYCYAAFFTRTENEQDTWGFWVQAKENALQLLRKFRTKPLVGKTIYMSSVTDPYQPVEKELELTRSLLKELIDFHQPRLVIQTRSPIILRDIDLLQRFKHLQVNMSITTDSESVRKIFEPLCPSNEIRLKTIEALTVAGIDTKITMTPLLPLENVDLFVSALLQTGVKSFTVQDFHSEKGKFIAGTREGALALIKEFNWTHARYNEVERILIRNIPQIEVGKAGFKPI